MTNTTTEKEYVRQKLTKHHLKGRLSQNSNSTYKPKYEKQNHITFRRKQK